MDVLPDNLSVIETNDLRNMGVIFSFSSRLSMHREARFEVSQALFSREQHVGRLLAVLFIKNMCL